MFSKTRQKISQKVQRRKTKIEDFLLNNKSRISLAVFFGGFTIDAVTLTRIDAVFGNIVLSLYLLLALFSIILMNWGDYKDIKNKFLFWLYQYTPFITQFSFGALFSGFVVYYTTSGTLSGSWPFLLILYLLFIANEKFQKHYEKFEFQIGILFLSLFAFWIFFLPVIAKKIGDEIFIASGIFSLFIILWIVKIIFRILPILKIRKWKVIRNVFIVFFLFNLAYFSNIIPPVPLSIKNTAVVYNAGRDEDGKYMVVREKRSWNDFYNKIHNMYYKRPDDKVYFYSSVFAPNNLKTDIIHKWQKYDDDLGKWVEVQRVAYKIEGGRNNGYRGYSFITKAVDGLWRVDVVSRTGLLIGREEFRVRNVREKYPLNFEKIILN